MITLNKTIITLILALQFCFSNSLLCQVDSAYLHLYNVMDKYHLSFYVFADQDAGGNNFFPSFFGDYQNLTLSADGIADSLPGYNCLKINYSKDILSDTVKDWAGLYWLYPESNWGNLQGYNLTDADSISFWAKGAIGNENIDFKIGGINKPTDKQNILLNDTFDLFNTGIITLKPYWKRYSINLVKKDSFYIYQDDNSGYINHYIPAMWFNGSSNMKYDQKCIVSPQSGETCIKVEWDGQKGKDSCFWNGIMWQAVEDDVNKGYNLTGASKLSFWARSAEPGLEIKFLVGIDKIDPFEQIFYGENDGWASLDTIWKEYTIDLTGKDLSRVAGGFGFTFDAKHTPSSKGCKFYLDNIRFDNLINKDLLNIIGGFCCTIEKEKNPNGCSFYLDNIQYHLNPEAINKRIQNPHFLVSYEATDKKQDEFIRNAAYIYDNALALIALMNRGTQDDWKRAGVLANTFVACQKNERDYKDGRLRNGYISGDVIDFYTGIAKIPGAWSDEKQQYLEDEFSTNTHTGNIAWSIIALSKYYKEKSDQKYLDCLKSLGNWINDNTYDSRGDGGFTGGYEGFGHSRVLWKSTEHNLDTYVAFKLLYDITKDIKWDNLADHAKKFVEAMWNNENSFFWTGTTQDGITINQSMLVEDVQAWALLVFKGECKYQEAINWVYSNCYTESDGFKGFDFNNDKDGIWFEGTAHMCLTYQLIDQQDNSNILLNELRKAQSTALNNNGLGIVAASHDNLSTGITWLYHSRLHIGATAWYIFAENGYNPYWLEEITPVIKCDLSINKDPVLNDIKLYQNYPNPFTAATTITYYLPESCRINISLYTISGELVRNLADSYMPKGFHSINLKSSFNLEKGIYIYKLCTLNSVLFRKCVYN
jgi:hypothetical protein